MSDIPKFDETDDVIEAPKFDDTEAVSFDDTTPVEEPTAPASEPTGKITDSEFAKLRPSSGGAVAELRGLAQGGSAGYVDEGTGTIGALWDKLKSKLGDGPETDLATSYAKHRDESRKNYSESEKEFPAQYRTGQVAGGAAISFVPGLGALNAGKGAGAAEIIGKTALQGVVTGSGESEADTAGGVVLDAAKGGALSAGFGAAGHSAAKGIGWLAEKGAKGTAKTLLTASEPVDKYVANPAKYNVDMSVDSAAKGLRPDLRRMEGSVKGAADESAKMAEDARAARKFLIEQLRSVRPSEAAERATIDALGKQRGSVSKLANEQMEMLGGVDTKHSLEPLDRFVKEGLDREAINGKVLSNDPEAGAIKRLGGMLDELRAPEKKTIEETYDAATMSWKPSEVISPAKAADLSPQDIAKLRQKIDGTVNYDTKTGAYDPRSARVAKQARSSLNEILDTQLPNSEEYKDLRGRLADETQFTEKASDFFGGERVDKALAGTSRDPKALQTLAQLDTKTKSGIMPEIAEYLSAQGKLRTPSRMGKAADALPETQAAAEAQKAARLKEHLHSRLNGVNSDNIDGKLREAMFSNKNNPKLRVNEGLQELSRRTGKDVNEIVDILKVRGAFGKEGANGSRLVNWLSNLAPGGQLGKGVAATVGAGLDVGRGKVAKGVLDTYLNARPKIDAVGRMGQIGITGAAAPAIGAGVSDDDADAQFEELMRYLKSEGAE